MSIITPISTSRKVGVTWNPLGYPKSLVKMDLHPPKICQKWLLNHPKRGMKIPKNTRPWNHQTPVVFLTKHGRKFGPNPSKSIISGDFRSGISAKKPCHVMHSCRPEQFLNNSRFNEKIPENICFVLLEATETPTFWNLKDGFDVIRKHQIKLPSISTRITMISWSSGLVLKPAISSY